MRAVPITEREQVAPERHEAFDEVVATYNGRVVGPLRVLFYRPELARRISNIGASMRNSSPFPAARELAIITAAREWDCLYEWYAHEPGAQRTDVSDDAIDVVRHRRPANGLPGDEDNVIEFVRALLRRRRVPEELFARMTQKLNVRGVVELTATVGFYQVFACVLNAFEVPPDADIDMPVEPSTADLVAPAVEESAYYGSPRAAALLPRDAPTDERGMANEAVERWGDGERAALDLLLHVPMVARNTAIAREWIRGQLTPASVTELASLTTARVNASPYLWAEHESRALEAGVSPAGVAMAMGMTGGDVPTAEAELIEFTRILLLRNRVPQPLFDRMLERLELEGLVELTAVIGFTSMLACLVNAFEVQR